ncbi:MAG TPA: C25 family cysteine peptidase, partial [Chloroflexota bacterium]|nr:C25 family cysteine peptidase [Chloroflexota bacterium]
RGLPCSQSCGALGWDLNAPYLVMTALPFVDRFQGMVPSDHPFVLLAGDDPLADMKIGRIAVNDAAEATNVINKIIAYESNPFPPPANPPFLFIADNDDPDAGYFCAENMTTANRIPGSFTKTHLCLGSATYPNVDLLRAAMFPAINAGAHVVNYRGHGSVGRWASEPIMTTSDTVWWNNTNKPTIVLSADCLDAYFAWPGFPGMGETFLRYDFSGSRHGSAAHWASTGLGFTSEHTILHAGFYDAVFVQYAQTIGSAIDYAKLNYHNLGQDDSELYTFTLQGDPAMKLYWAPLPPPTPTPTYTPTQTRTPTVTRTPTLTNTPPPGASLTPTPTLTNTPPPGASLTPTPRPIYKGYLPLINRP